jgi:hypothetical protein
MKGKGESGLLLRRDPVSSSERTHGLVGEVLKIHTACEWGRRTFLSNANGRRTAKVNGSERLRSLSLNRTITI